MPVGSRPKPPKETRMELQQQVVDGVKGLYDWRGGSIADTMMFHLLKYYTNVDLEMIRNDLRRTG